MKDRRVTVLDEASRSHFTVPYAAIVSAASSGAEAGAATPSAQSKPTPPPEIAGRNDFHVGHRVSFTDQNLQHRVGLVVRINQRTATLDYNGQTWRVAFGLLRHLVDVRPSPPSMTAFVGRLPNISHECICARAVGVFAGKN